MSDSAVQWFANARVDVVRVADDKDTRTTTVRIALNAPNPNCGILQTASGSAETAFVVVTDGSEPTLPLPQLKDSTSALGKTLQRSLSNLIADWSI